MTLEKILPATFPAGSSFHHIGYATTCVASDRVFFEQLGYVQEGPDFTDSKQGVLGFFMQGPGPRIELLENLPDRHTLTPWLTAGIKIYHFAYQVTNLDKAVDWARSQRGKMTVSPVPAAAFEGRRICFFAFRKGPMLEFIEM
ncbi:MAG: VOC family protein [Propionivibrio sp.]